MKIALQVCISPVYEELLTSGGIYVEYLKYLKKKIDRMVIYKNFFASPLVLIWFTSCA